jgi:hypothetical protein
MYSKKFNEIYQAEVAKYSGTGNKPVEFDDGSPIAIISSTLKDADPGTRVKIGNITFIPVGYYLCTECCRFFSEGDVPDTVTYHEKNVLGIPRIDTCPGCKRSTRS